MVLQEAVASLRGREREGEPMKGIRQVLGCALALGLAGPADADRVNGATGAINGFRSKVGLPGVVHSGRLQQAAERHARDLLGRAGLSHSGSDGTSVGARVKRTGYRFCVVAENLARGQSTLEAVILDWASSEGHRANLLIPEVREYGFARESGGLWVLVLARPGC